jgi:torsin-1
LYQKVKCNYYECCEPPHIRNNFALLDRNLDDHLYGQPLVKKTLKNALKGHFTLKNPRKALVLSFHGPTGVGKLFLNSISFFIEFYLF